jgi:hypothetical protein
MQYVVLLHDPNGTLLGVYASWTRALEEMKALYPKNVDWNKIHEIRDTEERATKTYQLSYTNGYGIVVRLNFKLQEWTVK